MKFVAKFVALVGSLVFAATVSATAPKLSSCPDNAAIKAQGISMVEMLFDGIYIAYEFNPYNTNDLWVFAMGPIESSDEGSALAKSNEVLTTLSGHPLPEEEEGIVFCTYNLPDPQMQAIAIQGDFMSAPNKFRRFFHK